MIGQNRKQKNSEVMSSSEGPREFLILYSFQEETYSHGKWPRTAEMTDIFAGLICRPPRKEYTEEDLGYGH